MEEEACPLTHVAHTKTDTSITLVNFQMTKVKVDKPKYTDVWLTVHRNSVWIRKTN